MSFIQIGVVLAGLRADLGIDMRHTVAAGSAVTRAEPSVAPQVGGGNPLRMEKEDREVRRAPVSLPPQRETWTRGGVFVVIGNGCAVPATTRVSPSPAARLFAITIDGVRVDHASAFAGSR